MLDCHVHQPNWSPEKRRQRVAFFHDAASMVGSELPAVIQHCYACFRDREILDDALCIVMTLFLEVTGTSPQDVPYDGPELVQAIIHACEHQLCMSTDDEATLQIMEWGVRLLR